MQDMLKDDETKADIIEAEVKDEVTLSRHQRSSKNNQPHSCMSKDSWMNEFQQ